jgi:hypothetical protein
MTLIALLASCSSSSKDEKKEEEEEGETEEKKAPAIGDESYKTEGLEEVSLTSETLSAEFPKLLFNGANYSILWSADGGRKLMFQKIGLDGKLIGTSQEIYSSTTAQTVVTEGRFGWAFSGSKYLVAFQASGVYFGIMDDSGNVEVDFTKVNSSNLRGFPAVASDGTDFGLTYATSPAASSPSHIIFQKILADGTGGDEVEVSSADFAFNPSISWNSEKSIYGLSWQKADSASDMPEVYFASVDKNGAVVTTAVRVTADDGAGSKEPVIVAKAGGFGIAFRDFREVKLGEASPVEGMPHIRLCEIDDKGKMTDVTNDDVVDASDEYMISSPYEEEAAHATLTLQGTEWGLAWGAQSAPFVIYFSQVKTAATGMTHARKQIISVTESRALSPSIASAADDDFFVVWMDERGEKAYQIYGAN